MGIEQSARGSDELQDTDHHHQQLVARAAVCELACGRSQDGLRARSVSCSQDLLPGNQVDCQGLPHGEYHSNRHDRARRVQPAGHCVETAYTFCDYPT